jgi:hypothetical protein
LDVISNFVIVPPARMEEEGRLLSFAPYPLASSLRIRNRCVNPGGSGGIQALMRSPHPTRFQRPIMFRRNRHLIRIAAPIAGAVIVLIAAAPESALAQQSSQEWLENCRDRSQEDRRRVRHCEVREATLDAPRLLEVSARPNGGIEVIGSERSDIRVIERVQTWGETEADARELAGEVQSEMRGGRITSTGPSLRDSRNRGWSVSYVISTPRRIDLDLGTVNGGIAITAVEGELSATTTNGGISMERVGGSVRAHTTNGGVDVRLAGARWVGEGLELRTTNGGIKLAVPDGFGAQLTASTVHGGINTDFPLTVQGRIGRRVEAEIGDGGPPVRLSTTNGGIDIRRN